MEVKLTQLQRARCPSKLCLLEAVPKFSTLLSTKITGFCVSLFTAMPAKCFQYRNPSTHCSDADGMVGFGILPRGYPLLGSFSACHLSPVRFRVFLTAEILTAKYFVEVVGRFSAVANCSLFRMLVQLPYGNGCQLKVCAAVHETTSAQNFLSSSGPGDASGNLFSTIKGYL